MGGGYTLCTTILHHNFWKRRGSFLGLSECRGFLEVHYPWYFLQQSTLTHSLFHTLSGPLVGVLLHSPHSENVFPIPIVFSCARIEADSNVLMNWTKAITHRIHITGAHRVGIITKKDRVKWVILLLGNPSIHHYSLPMRSQCTVNNHITRSNWPILFFD